MKKKNSVLKYNSNLVKNAFAIAFALFCLLVLLSPSTHMAFLSYPFVFLFGGFGMYAFFAFFFVLSLLFPFRKKIPSLKKRYYVVLSIVLVGAGTLLETLAFQGGIDAAKPALFLDELNASFKQGGFALIANPKLLGGFLCYELAGALAIPGLFLPYLIAGLLLFAALIIAFSPLLKKAFFAIRAKAKIARSKRPEEKQKKRARKLAKQQEGIEVGEEDPNAAFHTKKIPPASEKDRQEFLDREKGEFEQWEFRPSTSLPFSSRRQMREEQPIPSPKEPAPSFSPHPQTINRTFRSDELQEASFPFSDIAPQKQESAPQSAAPASPAPAVQEEPKLSEILAQPSPKKQEQPALSPALDSFPGLGKAEEPIPEKAEVVQPKPVPSEPVVSPIPSPAPEAVEKPAPQPSPVLNPLLNQPKQAPASVGEDAAELPPYTFPDASLLQDVQEDPAKAQEREDEARRNMEIINATLSAFNAGARAISYKIGPSVTRFDVQVDPNVQVNSLYKYETDISVHLAGLPTRYVPVIPGKTTSGFEVGNRKRSMVSFKEVFEALPKGPQYNLCFPFGKSIDGNVVTGDLSACRHMLVAGTTGSGKSVFMHGILLSLLMRNRPEDLKLILVDPKSVEFVAYEDLPNLLCPIITQPTQAKVALDKLAELMDKRFALFSKAHCRDIRSYNDYYAVQHHKKRVPYIVVVVDEYADLAMQCKEIEAPIQRLGQKARAAGIHLIISTQRPDANTISGTIKSNLPTTVCLMVKDSTASMVCLKQKGGEQLLDHGDMLVDCSSLGKELVRCQGCFVDEHTDLAAVPDFIRSQMPPSYDPEFLNLEEAPLVDSTPTIEAPSAAEMRAMNDEEKYQQIKSIIMTQDSTSISSIQRNFGVGFPRAGRIVARLQKEGIVAAQSDANGSSKGLKVLVHVDPNPGGVDNGATPGSRSSASTSFSEE